MARSLEWLCAAALVLGTFACGDDDGSPTDAGSDGAIGDTGVDAGMLMPPMVTSPTAGASVFGTVTVTGTAEPTAMIQVFIRQGASTIAAATGTASASGAFSVSVAYNGPSDMDALSVVVTQTRSGVTSDPTTVAVTHSAPSTLSGMISQADGSTSGTSVTIYAYSSDAAIDSASPVASTSVTATDGVLLPGTAYSLNVADGTYYLRAFRDSAGGDGLPTLDEAQAPLSGAFSVSGTRTGADLVLGAPTDADRYNNLNAFVFVESALPFPPRGDGEGLCGGTSLRLQGQQNGSDLTALWVRTPDGSTVELLDDGGCGNSVRDNTSFSYDQDPGDSDFSYGIPDPQTSDAGAYRFFFLQTTDDHIEIHEDTVNPIRRLSQVRDVTSPDTSDTLRDRTPDIQWAAVPNADQYRVQIDQYGGGAGERSELLTGTSFTVPTDLDDDRCYRLVIAAMETESPGDVDARSFSENGSFCIDTGDDDTVIISGSISNLTGNSGPYFIEVRTDDDRRASVRLPMTASNYALGVLDSSSGEGRVRAFIDVDGSGSPSTTNNGNNSLSLEFSDTMSDGTVDLVFTPPPVLTAPPSLSTVATTSPAFGWQDYATTAGANAPANFILGLFVQERDNDGLPTTIYALPPTATDFDLASPPAPAQAVDIVFLAQCTLVGGTYDLDSTGNPSCNGAPFTPTGSQTTLMADTDYSWGVVVIECTYPDFSSIPEKAAFVGCVTTAVEDSEFYAIAESGFTTP